MQLMLCSLAIRYTRHRSGRTIQSSSWSRTSARLATLDCHVSWNCMLRVLLPSMHAGVKMLWFKALIALLPCLAALLQVCRWG